MPATSRQLDLSGRDACVPRPAYDRDAAAEAQRLFEPAPAQIAGQTSLIDAGAMTDAGEPAEGTDR